MGFTRSTTDISVHQSLSDYPNQDDNLSAAQLKEKFDMPAETLQDDLNGLMTELEAVTSAESIGADVIAVGDESDANVQAKLEKIYADMQGITQGAVADGSITAAKLNSSLSSTLAYKNGNLQAGLNAEKLGGDTLATLKAYIDGGAVVGTYTGNTTGTSGTNTITVGFTPRLLIIIGTPGQTSTIGTVIVISGVANNSSISISLTSTGFKLTGYYYNYSNKTYNYLAIR